MDTTNRSDEMIQDMTRDPEPVEPSTSPCWCWGPWQRVDPADRPETTLGRQHYQGSDGCEYPVPSLKSTD